jgi:SAM-dependent methyltransferase
MSWVAGHATTQPVRVIDLGGRFINGSPRHLFPNAAGYTVLDQLPGPNVDIVADASTWDPGGRRFDVALLLEVCEHTPTWPVICRTAFRALEPGGRFIVTTAAPGRPPHSGIDGGPLKFGEYYSNIPPLDLRLALEAAGFVKITVDVQPSPADVRAVATKPKSLKFAKENT